MASSRSAKKRASYHHGDLAHALVESAVALIEKKGPDALTLREVTAAIGVTHGAAYRHFEDKTELLAGVAEEGYRQLAKRLIEVASEAKGSPRARLRALAVAYVAFAIDRPAHYRVMSGPRLNEDGRFPQLEAVIGTAFQVVVSEIERGQSAGAFRGETPRDVGVAIWVFAHGYTELILRRRIKVKSTRMALEYFGTLVDPLLDGLSAGDARGPTTKRRSTTRGVS